jgi:hypothetical protein
MKTSVRIGGNATEIRTGHLSNASVERYSKQTDGARSGSSKRWNCPPKNWSTGEPVRCVSFAAFCAAPSGSTVLLNVASRTAVHCLQRDLWPGSQQLLKVQRHPGTVRQVCSSFLQMRSENVQELTNYWCRTREIWYRGTSYTCLHNSALYYIQQLKNELG